MLIFQFKPSDMEKIDDDKSRESIVEMLNKFKEADEELERICKELGIEKPEMVCRGV